MACNRHFASEDDADPTDLHGFLGDLIAIEMHATSHQDSIDRAFCGRTESYDFLLYFSGKGK